MIYDLNDLLPRERRELDKETRQEYCKYYATEFFPKFGYCRHSENAVAFDFLCDFFGQWWAAQHGECDFPGKGLFIYGERGTGKTTVMRLFSGHFKVEMLTIEELTIAFSRRKENGFWAEVEPFDGMPLIIDDVCNEAEVKSYGNSIPLPEFFKRREEMWKVKRVPTFYTSNATGREEITRLYGDMVTSRLLGSCEFVKISGVDRRIFRDVKQEKK